MSALLSFRERRSAHVLNSVISFRERRFAHVLSNTSLRSTYLRSELSPLHPSQPLTPLQLHLRSRPHCHRLPSERKRGRWPDLVQRRIIEGGGPGNIGGVRRHPQGSWWMTGCRRRRDLHLPPAPRGPRIPHEPLISPRSRPDLHLVPPDEAPFPPTHLVPLTSSSSKTLSFVPYASSTSRP